MPDNFEPNDSWTAAAQISGDTHFQNLTIHSPMDEDYYAISIPTEYSTLEIDIQYDKKRCQIAAILEGQGILFAPQDTSLGMRFIESQLRQPQYMLHIYPVLFASCDYALSIDIEPAPLPLDWMEDNNSEETAKKIYEGSYPDLNIHDMSDVDYFLLDTGPEDEFDTSVTYDAGSGQLRLFVNGNEAFDTESAGAGIDVIGITSVGIQSPSVIRVIGNDRVWYTLDTDVRYCVVDSVFDCLGSCINQQLAVSRAGNGQCDNGQYGINLVCERFSDDGGDCFDPNAEINSACGPVSVYDCSHRCQLQTRIVDSIGDGFCDDGARGLNLMCPEFSDDGGDCMSTTAHHTCDSAAEVAPGSSMWGSINTAGAEEWL